jgi:hypothetical protein
MLFAFALAVLVGVVSSTLVSVLLLLLVLPPVAVDGEEEIVLEAELRLVGPFTPTPTPDAGGTGGAGFICTAVP